MQPDIAIQVDSGVPIPPPTILRPGSPAKMPWAAMKVGDSFIYPSSDGNPRKTQVRAAAASSQWGKRNGGKKFLTRIVEENGTRVVRVWRVA